MLRSLVVCALLLTSVGAAARTSTDLDVGWISRSPEIPYVWNSANPREDGWPEAGTTIGWRAHVRNWSRDSLTVSYRWELDGALLSSGIATLPPNVHTIVEVPWVWTFERHVLTFVIDSGNAVREESEANNSLSIFTDALAVGFWVEQSFYDLMRENQHRLNIGSAGFENWAQRHMEEFNRMAAAAIYPETPHGVLDRWRIEKIVVVPDGTLPLAPSDNPLVPEADGTHRPNDADRTVDMSWGFPAEAVPLYNRDFSTIAPSNIFWRAGYLIHELGHARYLIDTYAYRVRHIEPECTVEITEGGTPVVGTPLMPAGIVISNGVRGYNVFQNPDRGLMGLDYSKIDRHSAVAMNLIAGARAVAGHANEPQNFGVYLNDLPAQNRLTIVDANGVPVKDADVDVFQGERSDPDNPYSARYDDLPDLHFRTDSNGQVLVGRNPFTREEFLSAQRLAELVAIVRVRKGSTTAFGFLESRLFNLAYWRGERELADHRLELKTLEQAIRRRAVRK